MHICIIFSFTVRAVVIHTLNETIYEDRRSISLRGNNIALQAKHRKKRKDQCRMQIKVPHDRLKIY